jgi:hypothetical protein
MTVPVLSIVENRQILALLWRFGALVAIAEHAKILEFCSRILRQIVSLNVLARLSVGKDGDNKTAHAGTNVQVGALVCGG